MQYSRHISVKGVLSPATASRLSQHTSDTPSQHTIQRTPPRFADATGTKPSRNTNTAPRTVSPLSPKVDAGSVATSKDPARDRSTPVAEVASRLNSPSPTEGRAAAENGRVCEPATTNAAMITTIGQAASSLPVFDPEV